MGKNNQIMMFGVDCSLYGPIKGYSFWHFVDHQPAERKKCAPNVWDLAPSWANEIRYKSASYNRLSGHNNASVFCRAYKGVVDNKVAWHVDGHPEGETNAKDASALDAYPVVYKRELKTFAGGDECNKYLGLIDEDDDFSTANILDNIIISHLKINRIAKKTLQQHKEITKELQQSLDRLEHAFASQRKQLLMYRNVIDLMKHAHSNEREIMQDASASFDYAESDAENSFFLWVKMHNDL